MACRLLVSSMRVCIAAFALAASLLASPRTAACANGLAAGSGSATASAPAPASAPATLSGELELEFSSACQPPLPADAVIDMRFEGRVDLSLGPAGSCEFVIVAQPDAIRGDTRGYLGADVCARPGPGLELELAARGGILSDSDSPGDRSGDFRSSSLQATAHWQSAGDVVSVRASCEQSAFAYPYRPARDRVLHEASGYVEVAPSPSTLLRFETGMTRNEYRIADRNTSITHTMALEASSEWDDGMDLGVRLESRDRRYPHSARRSFSQLSGEAIASFAVSSRVLLESSVSVVTRSYPSAPAGDLVEGEIGLGVSSRRSGGWGFALEATLLGRSVPRSHLKSYTLTRLEAEYTIRAGDDLTASAELAVEGKRHADPAASGGDYAETDIGCKVSRPLAPDLDVTCEIGLVRREYALGAAASVHKVTSRVALVYRI